MDFLKMLCVNCLGTDFYWASVEFLRPILNPVNFSRLPFCAQQSTVVASKE